MIRIIASDFSRVLLLPRDNSYQGGLNKLHAELSASYPGYDVREYFELNEELLKFFAGFKGEYPLIVFTTGTIQNVPVFRKRIDEIFEKIYVANELGWKKSDGGTYVALANLLKVQPEEILYLDDKKENTEAALGAGVKAIQYIDNAQTITEIQKELT